MRFQVHPKEMVSKDYGVQLNHSACYRGSRAGGSMARSTDKSAQRLQVAGRPVASHRLLARRRTTAVVKRGSAPARTTAERSVP